MNSNDLSNISLLQIEVFLCVAECRSITEASRKMFISQSATTRWIQKLEAALNVTLFIRTNHGIELTEDGVHLHRKIKQLYTKLCAAFMDSSAADSSVGKPIRLACLDTYEVLNELPVILKRYENIYSRNDVEVTVLPASNLREGMLTGKYDCALTYALASKDMAGMELRCYKHMPTCFIVSSRSPAIVGDRLDYRALATCKLYISPDNRTDLAGSRDIEICRLHGFEPNGIRYASSDNSKAAFIAESDGVAIGGLGYAEQFGSDVRVFKAEKELKEEQYIGLLFTPDNCPSRILRFVDSVPFIKIIRN